MSRVQVMTSVWATVLIFLIGVSFSTSQATFSTQAPASSSSTMADNTVSMASSSSTMASNTASMPSSSSTMASNTASMASSSSTMASNTASMASSSSTMASNTASMASSSPSTSTMSMTGSTSTMASTTSSPQTTTTISTSTNTDYSSTMMTDNTTTATTTPTTTTTPEPTTTPMRSVDAGFNMVGAYYTVQLSVGPSNMSDIQYTGNNSQEQLEKKLMEAFRNATPSYISLMSGSMEDVDDMRMNYTLRLQFLSSAVTNDTQMQLRMALSYLAEMQDFDIPNTNQTNDIIAQFARQSQDLCMADNICPLGFSCFAEGCEHMCRHESCNGHGDCMVSVMSDGSASTVCLCEESYDTEYYGDRCQYDRRGKEQIIAILAAVLGTAVLILLIALIIMCVIYHRGLAHHSFDLKSRGYKNNAYDG